MQWAHGAWIGVACSSVAAALIAAFSVSPRAEAGQRPDQQEYRVLEPLQSGALTLFPVVRKDSSAAPKWDFLTLDEGLRSGHLEVTEAGKVRGMVRPRRGGVRPVESYRGDQVNTLVLVNNSDRPLLLLAGEIVTGGKQDRVIGKDRIVPAHSEPIDLSVFCIEPGRWVESSARFGASAGDKTGSFMVQPSVRGRAMVNKDQQEVWASVDQSMESAAVAVETTQSGQSAIPSPHAGTTSYAKAMAAPPVARQVDNVAGPLIRSKDEVLKKLREEHAVGVVVAVHGQIIWADLFASPAMLEAYWTKLVRSYAAESFDNIRSGEKRATLETAQRFLDHPPQGRETSEGETDVYRYREVRGDSESAFYLQVLLPDTSFYAHISRVVEEGTTARMRPANIR